jgi:ABC-2 type transport system permease protein
MSRFQAIVEQFREFERFFPVPMEQMLTYAGRVALTYEEPIVIVCMSVWAIARGSDCISGEIGSGTMEMLLAQPVSRVQVLWSQATVTIAGIALLAMASWIGIYTGVRTTWVEERVPAKGFTVPGLGIEIPNPWAEEKTHWVPMSERVDPAWFARPAFNLFSLGFFAAGLTTLLSSFDRYRWRSIGLVVGFYIVEMALEIVSAAKDSLHWLGYFTFFTAYEPTEFVSIVVNTPENGWRIFLYEQGAVAGLGPLGYDLILLGLGLVSYIAATFIFRARDLPAPV